MTAIHTSLAQPPVGVVRQTLLTYAQNQNLPNMLTFLQATAESYTFANELQISNLTPRLSEKEICDDIFGQRDVIRMIEEPLKLGFPRKFRMNHAEKIEDAQISLLRFKLSLAARKDNNDVALFSHTDEEQIKDIVKLTRNRFAALSLEKLQEKNRAFGLLDNKYSSGFFKKISLHYLYDYVATLINHKFSFSNQNEIDRVKKRLEIAKKIDAAVTKHVHKD